MKKNNFEKKYSLFTKYINDDITRKNMLDNHDLFRRYEENKELIKTFLYELDNRFTIREIREIITETIFKYPDEILKSFITAYLNSSETVKSKSDCYNDFKRIMFMGEEVIRYVTRNGIITDRTYKNIPEKIIDEKYKELKSGIEVFNNELLENAYKNLNVEQKRLVVDLLEMNSFDVFKECFERFNYSLSSILNLIINLEIPIELFDKRCAETLTVEGMVKIVDNSLNSSLFVSNIATLISNDKVNFIKKVIEVDTLSLLSEISNEEISAIIFDDKYLESMDIKAYLASLHQNTLKKMKEAA